MKKKFLLLFFLSSFLWSQNRKEIVLNWSGFKSHEISEGIYFKYPYAGDLTDVNLDAKSIYIKEVFKSNSKIDENSLTIISVEYESVNAVEVYDLEVKEIKSSINAKLEYANARGEHYCLFSFSPYIKEANSIKRVKKIVYNFSETNGLRSLNQNQNVFAIQNSVLATGDWYRFYIEKSGVYKLSKSFLQSLGLNVNVDPRTIKIYGNGGRMLPLLNSVSYPVDLTENAISFIGEDDGSFDDGDYILFYAEGVDNWSQENLTSLNLYTDKTYYYVTANAGSGKRIEIASEPTATPDVVFTKYNSEQYHEQDLVNIAKISRKWFGEEFNIDDEQTFNFNFPNLDTTSSLQFEVNVASKSLTSTDFQYSINGQNVGNSSFTVLPSLGLTTLESTRTFSVNSSNTTVQVKLAYNNGGVPTSNGYLNYIKLKATNNLRGYGSQFIFYNSQQATSIGVGEYQISNASGISEVWDVTDIYNVKKYNVSGANYSFKVSLGFNGRYVAVDNSDYYTPLKENNSKIVNQNLKGTIFQNNQGAFQDIDYLIITPSFLVNQAEKLANFHRTNAGLNVKVVKLEEIYNEFSSGNQDVAAIRNFIKYVYWNASSPDKRVKYINMFGDASYDFKDRVSNNTNIVPIFHALSPAFSMSGSFVSDDFFALMDDSEGTMTSGFDGLDIAIGRMVVSSTQQADEMVNKVFEYYDENSYGRWRNSYLIYSDDADDATDANLQFQIDDVADELTQERPFVNVIKIHTDSYIQQVSAGGERYPDAKNDFIDNIEKGVLVANYLGHGNEEFLARERLFERLEAQNLNNKYRYPLIVLVTCDFTRFDDPSRISGGEYAYLNTKGGGISLVATNREISVTTGILMSGLITERIYAYGETKYPTVAEAVRRAKLLTPSSDRRVVAYIGDPALHLAIPKPKVVLTEVNDVPVNQVMPVFQALQPMKIEGQIVDENDVLISNYNGDVAIQVFDKDINRSTLGNNNATNGSGQVIIMDFVTLGETVVRGNASVTNGNFEFNFIVPQDIRIPVGNGKVSFYAKRNAPLLEDQTGYNLDIQVGGVNTNAPVDNTPPTVQLYMNDESFVSGGVTNCSPILLAHLFDESGINTASGIGHDIVAILDGDETNPYILNDYYETELDDFTRGYVRFPLRDLEPGMHTILFKAWDVYNNLITMEIQFNAVCSNDGLKIDKVLNYPNPFSTYTEFWFTHNMPFEPLDVQVQIFTITGKVVKTINQQVTTEGFLSREVTWDGRDDFGDKIGKGVYVYKLTVRSSLTGKKLEKHEKLVIL